MFILVLTVILLVAYLLVNVGNVIVQNRRAHKFFQTRSPGLPIIPKPNILFGNIDQTTWSMKNFELIDRWHEKLGKTFGFYFMSQPWVSTKDIDLIKRIELDDAHKHLDRAFLGFPLHAFNTSIFQVNGDAWRQVRRAISPSLTNHKVRGDEVTSDIEEVIEWFVQALERKLGQSKDSPGGRSVVINAHNYSQRITLAIIMSVLYRRPNEVDFDVIDDFWTTSLSYTETQVLHPGAKVASALPFLLPFVCWAMQFTFMGKLNGRINDYIEQYVERRQAAKKGVEGPQRGLLDGFIDALVEKKINKEQLIGSANFLILAGYETTAATITCLLWNLAQNIDIQTKLREAIISEGIDANYVVWCIMETIRWHPPVPLGVGRVIGENINTNDGLFLPKGTFVMPSIYSIHHDESIWPQHDKFMPERWRDSSKFHPAAFMGFGLGPRNCVGGKMAVHEIKLALKAILTRYQVARCDASPKEYNFKSPGMLFTIPDEKVELQLKPLR